MSDAINNQCDAIYFFFLLNGLGIGGRGGEERERERETLEGRLEVEDTQRNHTLCQTSNQYLC